MMPEVSMEDKGGDILAHHEGVCPAIGASSPHADGNISVSDACLHWPAAHQPTIGCAATLNSTMVVAVDRDMQYALRWLLKEE